MSQKILVIEDDKLLQQLIVKKLKLDGFEVVASSSGTEALDHLINKSEIPDIIILDYHVPD